MGDADRGGVMQLFERQDQADVLSESELPIAECAQRAVLQPLRVGVAGGWCAG